MMIILVLLVMGLLFWPSYWVSKVMQKYREPGDLFPGTGGELAQHLLQKLNIEHVRVEEAQPNQDHYDPIARAVRLSPDNFNGKSLTAITIAAHEVGHAIQHASGYSLFRLRHRLVNVAQLMEKLGSAAIMAMPVIAVATRSPALGGLLFGLGLAGIAFGTLVHLVTLPVEWDASFKRALPLLAAGDYISESQSWHAHKILKAAAFTYVAGSLASLLNLYRWIAILRR
ncbi:MAG: zinc metallopeptidase [Gammaproteobacteria bacterium]|nr:MAG: zinc metallopeptidase [Gammaproteobacteria bacterium]